jgi:polyphenol oxidase
VEFDYAEQLVARPEGAAKRHLDVRAGNVRQLADAGVSPERTYNGEYCTMTRTDLFFSYRREGGRGVGRLLSVIGRR